MTKKQRTENARKAAKARWAKTKKVTKKVTKKAVKKTQKVGFQRLTKAQRLEISRKGNRAKARKRRALARQGKK